MDKTKNEGEFLIGSGDWLECPNCQDGVELAYDGEWYEIQCLMCGGSGMLDKKKSDALKRFRDIYQKMKHSNDVNQRRETEKG